MRWIPCLAMAAALQVPAIVYAQEVSVSGWLERFDKANSTLTIRSLGGNRTIAVAPNAVVRLNGAVVRLDQLPANSSISVTTQKDGNDVLRATEITATNGARVPQPSAAAPAGSLVRGKLVGMDIPNNSLTIRTVSGDHTIPMGTAPIIVNGVRGSTRDLRVGQTIQVERTLPTEASQQYVTQMVRVLPAQKAAPRTSASTKSKSSAVRSRTRGSRSTYTAPKRSNKSQRSSAEPRTETLRRTVWKGISFQPVITFPGVGLVEEPAAATASTTTSTPARATAPPALPPTAAGTTATPVGPGAAVASPGPAAAAPAGVIVVPDAPVVAPDAVVISPGTAAATPIAPDTTGATAPGATGIVGTAPQTNIPDARFQSPATAAPAAPVTGGAGVVDRGTALSAPVGADPRVQSLPQTGVANPRAQSPATPGAVPPAVADPRNQGIVAPGVVAPGAVVPPANFPNPRNQGIVTPGAVLPSAPAGVGTPGGSPAVTPGAILPGAAAPPVGVPDPRFQAPAAPGIVRPGVVSPVFPGPVRRPLAVPVRPGVIRPRVPVPVTPAPVAPR